jgi:hypothetical protein
MKSTTMDEEYRLLYRTDKLLEDLIQSTVSDILERGAINKQEQQVVHEQATALVKLSQKEQTPKQNVPKRRKKQRRKGRPKQMKVQKKWREKKRMYNDDATVSNMREGVKVAKEWQAKTVNAGKARKIDGKRQAELKERRNMNA